MDNLYFVNVSQLEIRKVPSERSNIYIKRDTVVSVSDKKKQYKKETWVEITTVSNPIMSGYVPLKYIVKIQTKGGTK